MTLIYIVFAFLCSTALGQLGPTVPTASLPTVQDASTFDPTVPLVDPVPDVSTTPQAQTYTTSELPQQYRRTSTALPSTDPLKICESKCSDYCVNCTEPVRCQAGQKNCGKKPINPLMSQCSTDDICVPENCECKYFTL